MAEQDEAYVGICLHQHARDTIPYFWKLPREEQDVVIEKLRAQLRQQERIAAEFMARRHAYAESIGCTFVMDETICTEEQMLLLAEWWKQNTKPITP